MAINNNGSLSFELQLKMAQFKEDAKRASQELSKLGKTAEDEGKRIDNSFSNIGRNLSSLGAVVGAQQLVKEIVRVRGEFQKLDVAFTTMLGSQEKATALMNQLVSTAATTPFGLQDVAGGAKQLLAYGMEAEKINDTLIRLGDIAAGLSIPLGDMTYLFGTTMVQGRMYTQDLNQFVGRGIPLIKEFAEQFGVAESKVKDLVTEGKIGFNELNKAIMAMTSEGGQFAGLMEAQSQTIAGQIANLEDAIDMMFNEIGQASQGIITEAIGVASTLVENYEKVGKILLGLVTTYGVYKAAVIAMTAVYGAQTIGLGALTMAEKLHYAWLVLVEKAQKILNATMLSNPYVLVATAIAGVVAYLVTMRSETELIAEAEAEYNAKLAESARIEEERKQRVKELIKVVEDESASTKARKASLIELEKQYPTIFEKYDTEAKKLRNLKKIKLEIAELDASNDIKEYEKQISENEKRIAELTEKSEKKVNVGGGLKSTIVVTGGLSRKEEAEQKMLKSQNEKLAQEKKKKQEELDALKNPPKDTTTTTTTTTDKKSDNKAKKEAERRLKLQQELANELLQLQQDNQQAEIDLMEDGTKKRLAQINHDFELRRKEIEALEKKWKQENIEAGIATEDNGLTSEQNKAIDDAKSQNISQANKARQDENKANAQALRDYLKEYGNYQAKRLAIAEDYAQKIADAESIWVKKGLEKERDRALANLDIEANKTANIIGELFSDLSNSSVADMRRIADESDKMLKFLNGQKWDDKKGLDLGITKEVFDMWANSPEQLEQIRQAIQKLRDQADDCAVGFEKMKIGLDKMLDANNIEKFKEGLQELIDGIKHYTNAVSFLTDEIAGIGEAFDSNVLKDVADGLNVALSAVDGAIKGAEAFKEFGLIASAIGATIGLASSLAQSIAKIHDKKNEKAIEALADDIDELQEKYDDLADAIDKAYSTDASKLYDEQNKMLREQIRLIEEQKRLEEDKKNTDEDRLKDWEKEQKNINKQIKENEEKAVDAIFGQDIKSAIENFADAYVEAWSGGSTKVKDIVRQMMQNMVKESIKGALQSSKAMEEIRLKMREFYADKEFQNWEQQELYKMAEEYQKQLDKDFAWAEDLFKDTTAQQASNGGFQAMSQDTGSELNGRFTTMVELQSLQLDKVRSLAIDTAVISQNISEMRNLSLLSIGYLESIAKSNNELYQMNYRLGKIEENTSRL